MIYDIMYSVVFAHLLSLIQYHFSPHFLHSATLTTF